LYCDDVVVYSHSLEKHYGYLHEAFGRPERYELILNPEKITLVARQVKFPSHILSGNRISVNESNVKVQKLPESHDLKGDLSLLDEDSFVSLIHSKIFQINHTT
jgi:hypothetical protein